MLDTQEQIEQFRQFLDVGGLKEAENLTRGKSLKVKKACQGSYQTA